MEIGKKMMEKWGWNKGQGLGKDKQGMKSCLVLKKQDGSSTQGRIEQAAPQVYSAKTTVKQTAAEPPPPGTTTPEANPESNAAAALCAAAAAGASPGLLAAMGMELGVDLVNRIDDAEEPAAKRRRAEEATAAAAAAPAAQGAASPASVAAVPLYDIDPRDTAAAGAAAAVSQGQAGSVPEGMAEAALAAAAELQAHMAAMQAQGATAAAAGAAQPQPQAEQLALALIPSQRARAPTPTPEPERAPEAEKEPVRYTLLGDGPVPADYQPPPRKPRIRQYVRDDWRWSKGTEALWHFEEVQLAPSLLTLARKVLGEGSRYPARITDDTDCVTEVTAWGTLLVRPRGTGANMPLAKRMLFEVLHPMSEDLREEITITPDEMAEAALLDRTLIGGGMENSEQVVEGVERSAHGKLKRVGLGAEEEALAETTSEVKPSFTEIVLATNEDAALVKRHLEDLRIASGCTPVLNGVSLKLFGKEKPVKKGRHLVHTLIETGEWVALTEGFVLSEETKGKRRGDEGPSEQILIKVPEGGVTQLIEQHLKAMERAAQADQLKLTSKAVGGKRTLMVEGTRAVHERVKLMVKELSEKGESKMLTKALGVARAAERQAEEAEASPAAAAEADQPRVTPKPEADRPGVISKPPVPVFSASAPQPAPATQPADAAQPVDAAQPAAAPEGVGGPGLGAGPAMRHLPPPRLAVAQAAGNDLFAGLPAPEFPATAGEASAPEAVAAGPSAPEPALDAPATAAFPPLPPGMAGGGAPADLFAGLPTPSAEAASAPAGPAMPAAQVQEAATAGPPAAAPEDGVTE